jgi:hypothetical protein
MNVRTRLGYALVGAAALTACGLLAISCSRKPTRVDASYTTPEGTPSSAGRLVLWNSLPAVALHLKDLPPVGGGPEDSLMGTRTFHRDPEGTLRGMVFDGTPATAYQVLRREVNGGLRNLTDYTFGPTRRWLDSDWEVYEFTDPRPLPTPSYIGRGVVAGNVTTESPLTNEAQAVSQAIADIRLFFPTDTTVVWNAVPGAALYFAHIYQLRQAPPDDQILSGLPAPIYRGLSRDFLLGITDTPQQFGRDLPFNGIVLTRRNMPPAQYLARVSAVDAQGQLIAYRSSSKGANTCDSHSGPWSCRAAAGSPIGSPCSGPRPECRPPSAGGSDAANPPTSAGPPGAARVYNRGSSRGAERIRAPLHLRRCP